MQAKSFLVNTVFLVIRSPYTVHVTRNFTKSDEFCGNSAQLTSALPCYFRGTSSLSADRLCPYPRNVNASAVLRTRFVLVRICTLRGLSQAFPQTITFNNEQQRLNVHTRGARLSPANQIRIILFTFWSA